MRQETQRGTMAAAFVNAGLFPEDITFDRAIALYLNNGGTIERAMARLAVAAKKLPGGHQRCAEVNGHACPASRQPDLPQGQGWRAVNGQITHAERETELLDGGQSTTANGHGTVSAVQQPQAGGEGQGAAAAEATLYAPTPAREQTASQIEALAKARQQAAKSIFDRVLTITGRAWGNITYRELREYARDGEFARAIMAHIGSKTGKDGHKMLRDLIDVRAFGMIAKKHAMVQQ